MLDQCNYLGYFWHLSTYFGISSERHIKEWFAIFFMIYYLDTSIWLDFFENRNEPNFPKGDLAHVLLSAIIDNDDKIIYSDITLLELIEIGYQIQEIRELFKRIKPILIFVKSTEKEARRAKDLSEKRDVPKKDALHALIARDNKSILVTFDNHFKNLLDIIKPKKPQDII